MTEQSQGKPRPTVREYEGEGIVVRWEPRFCIHSGLCVRDLPGVFDRMRRPWIDATQTDADTLAGVVANCPSGALHFRRTDGGAQETAADVPSLAPQPDGPVYVRGHVRIMGEDGEVLREDTRVALCRCGASKHKPFCDGTHEHVEWRSG